MFFFFSWIFLSDHSWFYIPLWIFIWVYLYTVTKYVLTHLDPCNFLSMIFSCLSLYLLIFLSRSLFSKGLKFLLFILGPISSLTCCFAPQSYFLFFNFVFEISSFWICSQKSLRPMVWKTRMISWVNELKSNQQVFSLLILSQSRKKIVTLP